MTIIGFPRTCLPAGRRGNDTSMILNIIDKRIRQAFSDAAIQYDVLTSFHKEIGRELIKKMIPIEENERILDVGMGTGWFTSRLAFYFPESKIFGLDSAEGMVKFAKKYHDGFYIMQADAKKLPLKADSFDIIVSNLAYQWMEQLPDCFSLCHQALKKDGHLRITMFGQQTFQELFESIQETQNGKQIKMKRLASRSEIEQAVRAAGFRDVHVDYEIIKVHFPEMKDLLRWIKDIGANALNQEPFIGKDWLKRTNDYYDQHYRDRLGIYSTFEVIWIEARQ